MRAPLLRYREGKPGGVPFSFALHLVAARYGVHPPSGVLAWPADEVMRAIAFESFMGGSRGQ